MKLAQILPDVSFEKSLGELDVEGLASDSREVRPGFVFFAISGTQDSGLKYITDAEQRGAIAVIHDTRHHLTSQAPLVPVKNVRESVARAASLFFGESSRQFYLTGITGTNGKTTFTYLMNALAPAGTSGVIGTVKIRYGNIVQDTAHTTPDAITLQNLFANMRESSIKTVAMEVSSHALEQYRAHFSHFDSAVFTNLTQDHLDYHKDMENYFAAKLKLFTECLVQSDKPKKRAVINIDSPYGQRIIQMLRAHPEIEIVTSSLADRAATIFLEESTFDFSGTRATLNWSGEKISLATNLIGAHNVQNIMGALLAGEHRGFDRNEMISKLSLVQVPGRLERVGNGNIFVDYAHSPDALENVINAMDKLRSQQSRGGRLVVLFGCGGDRDQLKRPLMGEIAAKRADVVLITSDNPRTEDPRDIIDDILEGVIPHKKKFDGKHGYLIEVDRETALEELAQLLEPEDIALIAGKGHEDYQIIGKEKRYFDDREILAGLVK